eukprot:g2910.t1
MEAILDDLLAALPEEEGRAVAKAIADTEASRQRLVAHNAEHTVGNGSTLPTNAFIFNGASFEPGKGSQKNQSDGEAEGHNGEVSVEKEAAITESAEGQNLKSKVAVDEAVAVSLPSFDSFINSAGPRPDLLAANASIQSLRKDRRSLRRGNSREPGKLDQPESNRASFSQRKLEEAMAYASQFTLGRVDSSKLLSQNEKAGATRKGKTGRLKNSSTSRANKASKARRAYGLASDAKSARQKKPTAKKKKGRGKARPLQLQPQSKSGLRPSMSQRGGMKQDDMNTMIENFQKGLEVQRLRAALEASLKSKRDSEDFIESTKQLFTS